MADGSATTTPEILNLSVKDIDESPTNPRKTFDEEYLQELAADFKVNGILQPVTARPKGKRYELVFGACRYRAAKIAGVVVPTIVRKLEDAKVLELQLIENGKRKDVHPLEEAEGYEQLHTKHGYSFDVIADKLGKPRAFVVARIKLLALVPEARKAYLAGQLTIATAIMVARIPASLQKEAVQALTPGWTDGAPLPARRAIEVIGDRFMLRLASAPFDRGDASLVKGAGTCAACPKRTGNQRELFADVKSPDVCTDPICFGKKRDAGAEMKLAELAALGVKILSDTAAKKLYPYGNSALPYGTAYVDFDTKCEEDPKHRTYRQLLKGAVIDSVAAKAPDSTVHQLADKGAVAKLVRAAGVKGLRATDVGRSTASKSDAERRAKEMAKQRLRRATTIALIGQLVAAAEKKAATVETWRMLALGTLRGNHHDTNVEMVKRRGLTAEREKRTKNGVMPPKDKVLAELVAKMSEEQLRGFIVEAIATRGAFFSYSEGLGESIKAACAFYKIDVDKVRTEAKAAVKKPKPAKTTRMSAKAARADAGRQAGDAGVCRVCRCTDDEGCEEGCTWVEPDLCSSCEGEVE